MLRKRYIIETINNMLKNMAQIVHSRHRSVNDFIMNLISALGAYVTTMYGAQNEAYMSRSAEKWVRGLCFNELGVCS